MTFRKSIFIWAVVGAVFEIALGVVWMSADALRIPGTFGVLIALMSLCSPQIFVFTKLGVSTLPTWASAVAAVALNAVTYATVGGFFWTVGNLLPGGYLAERIRHARRDKYSSNNQQ